MAVEARLTIRHWGCVVSECLTGGAQAAHVTSDRDRDVVVMQAATPEQVDVFLENVRRTQESPPEVVMRGPLTIVLRLRTPEWGVYAAIVRSGCGVLWPAVWHDGLEKYAVLATDRSQLERAVAALSLIADVRVDEVTDVTPGNLTAMASVADLTAGLTDRQLAALRIAIDHGYYATPRAVTAEALARRMGVARTTFEEHLRKAEGRVFPRLGAVIAAHPGLAEGAKAKRGRPPKRQRPAYDGASARRPRDG